MDSVKIPEDQIVPMDSVAPAYRASALHSSMFLVSRILTVHGRLSTRLSPSLPG